MGRTSIVVDVQTVGLCIDDIGISSQSIEHRFSDVPGTTVSAIQTNLDALEGVDAEADQVAHVTIAACHIIHSAADVLTMGKRQFRPVLIEYMELSVNVILHQQQGLLGHFFTVTVYQFDAVIIVGVVAGRDHNAAIKVIHTGNVGHGRRGSDMQQVGFCTRGGQACDQTILEHIGAATGILTNDDTSGVGVTIALTQSIIIPAQKTTDLIGMVCC